MKKGLKLEKVKQLIKQTVFFADANTGKVELLNKDYSGKFPPYTLNAEILVLNSKTGNVELLRTNVVSVHVFYFGSKRQFVFR